jgi:KilA-N domain
MSNLIFKDNNIRTNKDMVCLTDMAKPYGKKVNDWVRVEATEAYLSALSAATGIPAPSLLVVLDGKPTFAHPEVAIHFAQWLSPEFHVWCNIHIRQLVETGKTQIVDKSILPARDTTELTATAKDIYSLPDGYLKELLRDSLVDELNIRQGKTKAIEAAKIEHTIGKVRAKELGYSLEQIGNGSGLGKWLKKSVPISFTERVGKYDVNHYEVNPTLDTSIHTYFSLRATMKK